MDERESWCPGCTADRDFETPPCAEHGADCPELACSVCGWALIGSFELAASGFGPADRADQGLAARVAP